MTDLSQNEKPLGLMSPEDRKALMDMPWDQIEVYGMSGWNKGGDTPIWLDTVTYRAKREPRRFWIVGGCEAYSSQEEAERAARDLLAPDVVEVIEVTK